MRRMVPAALLGVLLLAGCGAHSIHELRGGAGHGAHGAAGRGTSAGTGHGEHGGVPPGSPVRTAAGAVFNAADVMFLQMMVPHNGQGVELVRLARERPVRPEVRRLAEAIGATQEHEAASMAGLLRTWGRPATAEDDEHAAHGGMPEISEEEIAALTGAPPAEFERRFLNMLIAQQDDAAQMARAALAGGLNSQVREMAGRVDASRTAQISQMIGLLGR
ncbi:uncharacterized protein (DUF305 family) [Streptosporangium becharense]|uniref:Uncharacterized protein (DUF305 family) n=1 Tax=Streptosporangium becharense TaxID=1816182 RepID=A0A7W9MIK0_9ACTN|nr:DUF305 domain-containing protein [Streptosporangium becharense]MBB2911334.1 uncharacterized protein (DUF305 family) [Streptosporangium becharense]MBB5821608.1 uncharacterized protein (DUF305 family) [Streptosporangium becharense]